MNDDRLCYELQQLRSYWDQSILTTEKYCIALFELRHRVIAELERLGDRVIELERPELKR